MSQAANHMPMILGPEVFAVVCWLIALPAILLAILLGVASWYSALRVELDGTSMVFARGFLGVSAALCGALGLLFAVVGTLLWLQPNADVSGPIVLIASGIAVMFLAVEFIIAGTLYAKVNRAESKAWPRFLSWSSYGFGGLLALVALFAFGFALLSTMV